MSTTDDIDIEHFLTETSEHDATLVMEPSFSSLLEACTYPGPSDSLVPIEPPPGVRAHHIASNRRAIIATMPTPCLPPPDTANMQSTASLVRNIAASDPIQLQRAPSLLFGTEQRYDRDQFQSSAGYKPAALSTRLPFELEQYYQNSSFADGVGETICANPEAMTSFLAGKVRPGGAGKIYKCHICCVEFPTAQAYGGHMTSHNHGKAKNKKGGKHNGSGTGSSSSSNWRRGRRKQRKEA